MKKWLLALTASTVLGLTGTTWVLADDDDHEVARRAVERGELLPLATILEHAKREYPGRVIEVDLDREHGRYLYEIEILLSDGRVIELTYDGKTGALLETEIEDDD